MKLTRRDFIQWACLLGGAVVAGWVLARRLLRTSAEAVTGRGASPGSQASKSFLTSASQSDGSGGGTGARPIRVAAVGGSEAAEDLTEAMYYEKLSGGAVQCRLCFRQCSIPEGRRGFCENRENRGGTLYTLVFNRPCALQIDPIEKEPLFHFVPATNIFCVSTASCNYRCRFCQNWHLSYSAPEEVGANHLTASELVQLAKKNGCPTISHTYAEPTVHFEYLLAVAREARAQGLRFIYHTNLGIMPEPLKQILPLLSALSIDLKGFDAGYYQRMCHASLDRVLENLKVVRESGTYFELINLVLPTQNDDPEQTEKMSNWIRDALGADTPLHFSRFFPTHRFRELPATPIRTLERCRDVARKAGLNFVYIGNVPGHEGNSTFCPECGERLIHRRHFAVQENRVRQGRCPDCGCELPGVWA